MEQTLPFMQGEQKRPPQSVSVSEPFFSPSLHEAPHTLFVHTPLTQSEPIPQARPLAHLPHAPPQSTSLSVPFLTMSMQVGEAQRPLAQTPLVQSVGAPHRR